MFVWRGMLGRMTRHERPSTPRVAPRSEGPTAGSLSDSRQSGSLRPGMPGLFNLEAGVRDAAFETTDATAAGVQINTSEGLPGV